MRPPFPGGRNAPEPGLVAQSVVPTSWKSGVEGSQVQGQSGLQHEVQDEALAEMQSKKGARAQLLGLCLVCARLSFHFLAVP